MKKHLKILSLDISTKTGFAVTTTDGQTLSLLDYGVLKSIGKPSFPYPKNYLEWAIENASLSIFKIGEVVPDIVVIEETTTGRNGLSQKILEWTHQAVAEYLTGRDIETHYFMTGQWRSLVGAKMTNEEKKKNALSKKIKKATGKILAKDEAGKIIGRVTQKHVSVRLANHKFNLSLKIKDNDVADAINLSVAYFELLKTTGKLS